MRNLDSILKNRDITLLTKVCLVKTMVFPVVMYGCERWTIKKAEHRRIDAFELWYWRRLLRVPWTGRRSNQSILKNISPEYLLEGFIGRTAEAPILWSPPVKNWLIGKDPDAGKDWKQEEKGTTEEEMFGWHHRLNGHEFEQPLGVGDGQGCLTCCSPWGRKESDTAEWLNWTEHTEGPGLHSLGLWRGQQPVEAAGVGAAGSTMLGCAAVKAWDMQKGREKCKAQENAETRTSKTH